VLHKRISYEDLLANPAASIKRISDELGLMFGDFEITRALEGASKEETRRNKAMVGRGNVLTSAQKEKIYNFASYYPSHNFSPIGL
jgi:hypothetical protein